jgi:hypothetical protein
LIGPSTGGILDRIGAGGAHHIIGKFKPMVLGEIHAAGDKAASPFLTSIPTTKSPTRATIETRFRKMRYSLGHVEKYHPNLPAASLSETPQRATKSYPKDDRSRNSGCQAKT